MNIQQIRYILTVAKTKHFENAAEKCEVTQSTLSTMISKFESEIQIKVFDRTTKPVSITKEGEVILKQLNIISQELTSLEHIASDLRGSGLGGTFKLATIPTVAPQLLPRILGKVMQAYPSTDMEVKEMTTQNIQVALNERNLDMGIVALPLNDPNLIEIPLYSEHFVCYDCLDDLKPNQLPQSNISPDELPIQHLFLLEETHCLSQQVKKICLLYQKLETPKKMPHLNFKAGSIDSLVHFTKANQGITLLPYLATLDFNLADQSKLRNFHSPVPARNIGLVVHKHFVKQMILETFKKVIAEEIYPILKAPSSPEATHNKEHKREHRREAVKIFSPLN